MEPDETVEVDAGRFSELDLLRSFRGNRVSQFFYGFLIVPMRARAKPWKS